MKRNILFLVTDIGSKPSNPLIIIRNKTMIEWSVTTLGLDGQYIFVVSKEHRDRLEPHLKSLRPDCIVCEVAESHINNDTPLIIANYDQILEWDIVAYEAYLNEIEDHPFDHLDADERQNLMVPYIKEGNLPEGFETYDVDGVIVLDHKDQTICEYWSCGSDYVNSAGKKQDMDFAKYRLKDTEKCIPMRTS